MSLSIWLALAAALLMFGAGAFVYRVNSHMRMSELGLMGERSGESEESF
jgi:hypothetical protein